MIWNEYQEQEATNALGTLDLRDCYCSRQQVPKALGRLAVS